MNFIRGGERGVVRAVAALAECNPFLPERVEHERQALGDAFVPAPDIWHAEGDAAPLNANAAPLRALVERLGTELRQRLAAGARATAEDLADYTHVVMYLLFQRYEDDWFALIEPADAAPPRLARGYAAFASDATHFLSVVPALGGAGQRLDPAHLFALGFQARRAFHYIFRQIFGGSRPAARLRASVWQSIFTRDVRRYRAALYERMADIPTLISGESGTGKELVARAIARSCYVPFDARTATFGASGTEFWAVNLSALSPTLIESELFGHRRGAFTGAAEDRRGWFEACGAHGAVFLDEIGDLDPAMQVKLLRVLQSREFHRLGETTPRRFPGKVIAATHRDLEEEIAAGRFREDLYYRICADRLVTPTLREQLGDTPADRRNLLRIVAGRVAGPDQAERLAGEVEDWITAHLGSAYPWPGNMRELEQCVRNILVRGEYRPRRRLANGADPIAALLRHGTPTAEELVERYCAAVHAETGNLHETARRVGLDRRTVRVKLRARRRDAPGRAH